MSPAAQNSMIGIDLGGSKISAIVLDRKGQTRKNLRIATPQDDYHATCKAIKDLVSALDAFDDSTKASVGVGIPGSRSPATGLIRNANSTCLNGRNLKQDLEDALARPVRLANDADCFAVSEASDGAGSGAQNVWGLILGTGVGSGLVFGRRLLSGPLGIAGEWGHNPLPWPTEDEYKNAHPCWCGRQGCIETWLSGPALSADHYRATGDQKNAEDICKDAETGQDAARATLKRHLSRAARAMAQVINIIDPNIIVMGGGVSQMHHFVDALPSAIAPHLFTDHVTIDIRTPKWGDDSGVRGAARLWSYDEG